MQVSAMIGNLRNMASDMNGELENQNQQLDRVNLKASSDITRVKMANDKAASILPEGGTLDRSPRAKV